MHSWEVSRRRSRLPAIQRAVRLAVIAVISGKLAIVAFLLAPRWSQ